MTPSELDERMVSRMATHQARLAEAIANGSDLRYERRWLDALWIIRSAAMTR